VSGQPKRFYEFGTFRLDVDEYLLLRDDQPVPLQPKTFDTLVALVEKSGHVVSKEELQQRIWPDSFVEEVNLAVNISNLRKILGPTKSGGQYIETVPKRGYKFAVPVKETWCDPTDLVLSEYATSRIIVEQEETDTEEEKERVKGAGGVTIEGALATRGEGSTIQPAESAPPDSMMELASSAVSHRALPLPADYLSALVRRRRATIAVLAVATAIAIAGTLIYRVIRQPTDHPEVAMLRLTTNGRVAQVAISPDGKYVAYVTREGGKQGLWVTHVPTTSNIQIISPAEVLYQGLSFTPDGNYIDYVKAEKNSSKGSVYQIAVLGGASKRLFEDVSSAISFSPDRSRIAFFRGDPAEAALVVADPDGSRQRKLASRQAPDSYDVSANGPSWSPDGRLIACFATGHDEKGSFSNVALVRTEDGIEEKVYPNQWRIAEGLVWCGDGSGLLIAASDDSSVYQQIWHLAYPSGVLRRITNDVHGYIGVGLTADSHMLVTMQRNVFSSIWLAPNGKASQARQISFGTFDGRNGFSWTPDGRIVYTSRASGTKNVDLWIMDSDGRNTRQLTIDSGMNYAPYVTNDGRWVVFVSNRAGNFDVWRMDIEGENQRQLTDGVFDFEPQCTSDGKWVVFVREDSGKPIVWKVPFDGGTPVSLTDAYSISPAVSPDSKLVACNYAGEAENPTYKTALLPIEGGEPVRLFELPPNMPYQSFIHWTPDGRALTYAGIRGDAKIWLQPIDGGPPKELTDFKSDSIWYFDWSRDGKELACSRGGATSDVVLISGLITR